ncbi:hypothetical protein Q5P01_019156 [Channa striata]|uniref:Uncharacterized protein n=1 Tax=Channa striata TaxID=64152 RepID=A0AA88M2B2_CHASR|nr:hypothetical protein Q5P01_019156 [Channa striata]
MQSDSSSFHTVNPGETTETGRRNDGEVRGESGMRFAYLKWYLPSTEPTEQTWRQRRRREAQQELPVSGRQHVGNGCLAACVSTRCSSAPLAVLSSVWSGAAVAAEYSSAGNRDALLSPRCQTGDFKRR